MTTQVIITSPKPNHQRVRARTYYVTEGPISVEPRPKVEQIFKSEANPTCVEVHFASEADAERFIAGLPTGWKSWQQYGESILDEGQSHATYVHGGMLVVVDEVELAKPTAETEPADGA